MNLFVALIAASGIVASPSPEPALIDSVEVTARSHVHPIHLEPGLASVRTIENERERVLTVADVLERMAGVRVRRFGGLGAATTVSVRGLAPSQVSVLVDGISLDSGQFGAANLNDLPLEQVEQVQVYRSGTPGRFGDTGLGGVVNIVTGEFEGVTANLVGGPQDTWKSHISVGGELAGFHASSRYRHLQTRGDFSYLDDRGTTVINEGDDRTRRRRNNAVREHALLTRVASPPFLGARASVQHLWFDRNGGVPGYLNLNFQDAFFESDRHAVHVRLAPDAPIGGRVTGDLVGYRVSRDDLYANPSKETGLALSDIRHDQNVGGARAHAAIAVPEIGLTPSVSVEQRAESFRPSTDGATYDEFERTRDVTRMAADLDYWTLSDRVHLRAGYRHREATDNYFGPIPFGRPATARKTKHTTTFGAPEFGALVRVHPLVTVRGNVSEYARFPTMFELFGNSGEVVSNPELTAEVGTTRDIRVDVELPRWRAVRARVEIGAYTSERDSLIVLLQNGSRGNFKATNLERAEARGLEIEANLDIADHLSVRGSFTSQDVRQLGSIPHWRDRWLPYVSAREGAIEVTARRGRVEARTEAIWYGGYFRDPANRSRVPGHATLHAGLRVQATRRAAFDVDVQNLADSSVSDVYGYPMPGRSVFVGMTVRY